MTKKWVEEHDLSNGQYSINKNIRFKGIRNNKRNYVKGIISVTGNNLANRVNKKLTFKNNAPLRTCI